MKTLFILDDEPIRHTVISARHVDHYATHTYNAREAMAALERGAYDLAYFDHDLGDWYKEVTPEGDEEIRERTGLDVVRYLVDCVPCDRWPREVIVHSWNGSRALHMVELLKDKGINARYHPFTR